MGWYLFTASIRGTLFKQAKFIMGGFTNFGMDGGGNTNETKPPHKRTTITNAQREGRTSKIEKRNHRIGKNDREKKNKREPTL